MKKNIIEEIKSNLKLLLKIPVISWALYDLANTSFAIIIITIVFPVYFTNIIANPKIYPPNFGDLMWGLSNGLSMLLALVCAPIFGAIADSSRGKSKFLTVLTLICIIFCSSLYFVGPGKIIPAMIIFILANFFYQTSMEFYNSFLPQLSTRDNTGIVSGFGFSLGYLGGFLILILTLPFIRGEFKEANLTNIRLTFLVTSAFFLIFSIPSFVFLRDLPFQNPEEIKTSYVVHAFRKLLGTLRNIKKHKNLFIFLISYFLFSNAFSVLALYISIYAKNTLNLSLSEIVVLFIFGQILTAFFSLFFGWVTDKIGVKTTINITLCIWIVIIVLVATLITIKTVFYMAYILAAIVTGSTLIASRSLMTFLTPVDREAEFFGFYAVGGKFSSILGPTAFGVISFLTRNQRIALLTTLFFLIGGLAILQLVKVPKERTKE
ncbi:MAG: MFS transporter [Actinobacteria bacterium]|nr:MFS transporter [Actinomycetota bacterium]